MIDAASKAWRHNCLAIAGGFVEPGARLVTPHIAKK